MASVRYMSTEELNSLYSNMHNSFRKLSDDIKNLTGDQYIIEGLLSSNPRGFPFIGRELTSSYAVLVKVDCGVQYIKIIPGSRDRYTESEVYAFLTGIKYQALRCKN